MRARPRRLRVNEHTPGGAHATAWERFWFEELEPYGLAAFRIFFGMFLLAYFVSLASHVEVLFSNRGVYLPVVLPDIAPPPLVAWCLFIGTLVVIVLFIVGWRTRVLTPVLLVLFLYHFGLNLAVRNTAYDRLILIILLLSCFAQLDHAWSVGRHWREEPVRAWAPRLIGMQLALLYLGSGLWKLISPAWQSADMLRLTLVGPWGSDAAFAFVRLGWPRWVYGVLTLSVIVFELLAPFALYSRRWQKTAIVFGSGFHVTIALLLNLPQFLVCVAVYPLFLEAADVRKLFTDRLRRRGEPGESVQTAP
jgi:hypothetical protein